MIDAAVIDLARQMARVLRCEAFGLRPHDEADEIRERNGGQEHDCEPCRCYREAMRIGLATPGEPDSYATRARRRIGFEP